jgi:rhodanese-related sulfurtransferase
MHEHNHHDHKHSHDDEFNNEFDIYPQQFLHLFNESTFNSQIIYIRELWEPEQLKIEGILSTPFQELPHIVKQLNPKETYYLISSQGFRSSYATAYLIYLGFENVYNVQTGLNGMIELFEKQKEFPSWLIK